MKGGFFKVTEKNKKNSFKESYESDGEMSKKKVPNDKKKEVSKDFFNTTPSSE